MELAEEVHEAALEALGARIRRGLVGEANLTNKIGEVARRAGGLRASASMQAPLGVPGWLRSPGRNRVPI